MSRRPRQTRRWEQTTIGFDPELQLVGSDSQGGDASLGLNIPSAVPANAQGRYMFLLASAQFGIGERARLVGMRQYLELGACIATGEGSAPTFPVHCLVQTPNWRFVDGNVTWGLRRLRPTNPGFYNVANADGLQWRQSNSPAQLFETGLLPPYAGKIPGDALEPAYAQFTDVRFPWTSDTSVDSLNVPIEGPCTIALFASVLQTNPATRLTMPGTPPFSTASGISVEDAFVANFSVCARYRTIAGSLIFEQDEAPIVKSNRQKYPPRIHAPQSSLVRGPYERQ